MWVCDIWSRDVGFCPLFTIGVHGQGQAKRQVFSWSMQLWFGACHTCWPQCPSWIKEIDWPVSSLINLEEPWLQHCPSCVQAGVKFGSQVHGFKPGVAVK